jgi:omega-amidase
MNKNIINIALVQENLVWENPADNLRNFEKHIKDNKDVDLFVFPELFSTGFTMNVAECGESISGDTISKLIQISRKYNISLCGTLLINDSGKYYNRFVFIDSAKDRDIQTYDKKHLFRMGEEHDFYTAGNKRVVIDFRGFRLLPLICYDLRFPVWSRYNNDYDLIIYVANWPAQRRNHWDALLRARAIENQAYVVGVNRIGTDGRNINYNGGTCVIDPLGKEICLTEDNKTQVIKTELDISTVNELREKFPAWKDKDDFELLIER